MDELKPCPFCGTTNMMKHDEDCYFTVLNLGLDTWRINTAWNRRAETHVPEWQPIETAPKDGTEIILGVFKPLKDIGVCYWRDDNVMTGWTWGLGKAFRNPTHWMPLPAAPEVKHAE